MKLLESALPFLLHGLELCLLFRSEDGAHLVNHMCALDCQVALDTRNLGRFGADGSFIGLVRQDKSPHVAFFGEELGAYCLSLLPVLFEYVLDFRFLLF